MSLAVYTKIGSNGTHQIYHHRMIATEDGDIAPTHRHRDSHVTTCHEGEITVWSENGGGVALSKGDSWEVPAHVEHEIEFKTRGSIAECVLILRFDDGTPVPDGYELKPGEGARLTALL